MDVGGGRLVNFHNTDEITVHHVIGNVDLRNVQGLPIVVANVDLRRQRDRYCFVVCGEFPVTDHQGERITRGVYKVDR